MRFTIATALAFASAAAAAVGNVATQGFDPVYTPEKDSVVPAGQPIVVKWSNPAPYTEGPVYIQVLGGKSFDTLEVREPKLATVDNKDLQYTWNVSPTLGDDPVYGLRFVWQQDEQIIQWSPSFTIKKAEGASSTVTVTSSQGVKTVTLSSATSTTTTTTTNTTTSTSSSTTSAAHSTAARNSTTVASTMSQTTVATGTGSQTTPPTTKPSSGAAHAAGSVAVLGGLVAALFAL